MESYRQGEKVNILKSFWGYSYSSGNGVQFQQEVLALIRAFLNLSLFPQVPARQPITGKPALRVQQQPLVLRAAHSSGIF